MTERLSQIVIMITLRKVASSILLDPRRDSGSEDITSRDYEIDSVLYKLGCQIYQLISLDVHSSTLSHDGNYSTLMEQ